jgi:CxxC-x17-CxxC domain-containing protein
MYAVICFECGKDTEIPFKPSGNRPVYCKECFAKRKAARGQQPAVSAPASISARTPGPQIAAPAAKKPASKKKAGAAKKKVVAKKKGKK